MNRKIEFRAWDGEFWYQWDKTLIEDEWLFIREKSTNKSFTQICKLWDDESLTIVEFTGLIDKNGKKIYEGDIVQRGVITFSRGKFTGTYYDGNGNLSDDWEDDLYQENNIEVLGNIYENSELLTND